MGRKKKDIGYEKDIKKRDIYYIGKLKNTKKRLVQGDIIVGFKYKLIILNPDNHDIINVSNLSSKDFVNKLDEYRKAGGNEHNEIYNKNDYEIKFLKKFNKEKISKQSKNINENTPLILKNEELKSEDDCTEQEYDYIEQEEYDEEQDTNQNVKDQNQSFKLIPKINGNSWKNRFNKI